MEVSSPPESGRPDSTDRSMRRCCTRHAPGGSTPVSHSKDGPGERIWMHGVWRPPPLHTPLVHECAACAPVSWFEEHTVPLHLAGRLHSRSGGTGLVQSHGRRENGTVRLEVAATLLDHQHRCTHWALPGTGTAGGRRSMHTGPASHRQAAFRARHTLLAVHEGLWKQHHRPRARPAQAGPGAHPWLRSHNMRRPSSVRSLSTSSISAQALPTRLASPPVARQGTRQPFTASSSLHRRASPSTRPT